MLMSFLVLDGLWKADWSFLRTRLMLDYDVWLDAYGPRYENQRTMMVLDEVILKWPYYEL